MKNTFRIIAFFLVVTLLATLACQKGDKIDTTAYMRITLDAFYADTSLFQTVQVNNEIVVNEARLVAGSTNSLLANYGQPFKENCRLRVTVIKKNNPNLNFDSIIYVTNVNEFLLLQLDPKKKPVFINKRLENATAVKPGKDSINIRFYFDASLNLQTKIPNIPANQRPVSRIRLKLYTLEKQANPNLPSIASLTHIIITGINIGELSPYETISFIDPITKSEVAYGVDILDDRAGSFTDGQRLLQRYKLDPDDIDGFIEGNMATQNDNSGKFQTLGIVRENVKSSSYYTAKAMNIKFLFGLD